MCRPQDLFEDEDIELHQAAYFSIMRGKVIEAQKGLYEWLEELSYNRALKGSVYMFVPEFEIPSMNPILMDATLRRFTTEVIAPFRTKDWEIIPLHLNPDEIKLLVSIRWW